MRGRKLNLNTNIAWTAASQIARFYRFADAPLGGEIWCEGLGDFPEGVDHGLEGDARRKERGSDYGARIAVVILGFSNVGCVEWGNGACYGIKGLIRLRSAHTCFSSSLPGLGDSASRRNWERLAR